MSEAMLAHLKVEESPSTYELQKLRQIHHEIIMMAIVGKNNKSIAHKLDVSETMVRYTLESEVAKQKIEMLREKRDEHYTDIFKRLDELAPLALHEMENLLVNPNTGETTKRQIASDILDRAGYGAVAKHADVSEVVSTKQIEDIKRQAREIGISVDAEVIEEEDNETSN